MSNLFTLRRQANRTVTALALASLLPLAVTPASAVQVITLDFDTFTDTVDDPDDFVYSPADRMAVKSILEEIFRAPEGDPMGGMFGLSFEIFDPLAPPPPFTTSLVKFNAGLFGAAEGIDFRNLDDADDAEVHAVPTLKLFDGTARNPELGGGVWTIPELTTPENVVFASAQIAAHEVGHLLGLRHHDAFGPIGAGIGVAADKYDPVYTGPVGMTLTSQHVMGLNSAVALNANTLLTPSHFSERSAIKLNLAAIEGEIGPNPFVVDESEYPGGDAPDVVGDAPDAPIPLAGMPTPNLLESPHPWAPIHGGPEFLPVAAAVVTGTIEDRGPGIPDADHFELFLPEPSRVTVEAISEMNVNTTEVVDMNLAILDFPSGGLVPYEMDFALTGDQFESTDAILFDVLLPAGAYVVEVFPDMPGDTGDYELLVYAVPDVTFPLIGDYNENMIVDAADYTVFRDALEAGEFFLPNRDPANTGMISMADFDSWVENFGEFDVSLLDGPPTTGVPEPTALCLVLLGTLCLARRSRP